MQQRWKGPQNQEDEANGNKEALHQRWQDPQYQKDEANWNKKVMQQRWQENAHYDKDLIKKQRVHER